MSPSPVTSFVTLKAPSIYKSLGSESVELEDYVGKNVNEVKAILEVKYELKVTVEKKDVTTAVDDPNAIIEQSIPAGTKVKKGDKITLYVANQVDTFPNIVGEGWTKDEVDAFCTRYELKCTYKEQETTRYEPGTIFEQSIRAGSRITKGTNLTLTVAVKPKPSPSPSTSPTTTPEEQEG